MVFAKCRPARVFTACKGAAARKQALKQKLAGMGAYHGVSLRLMLVDKQVDAEGALPHAALDSVHVIQYDSATTTLAELLSLVREAHRQNTAPFLSIAVAHHGADASNLWTWTSDLHVNLNKVHAAMDDLAPVVEVLAAALAKTRAGKAHIDLLACGLATSCKGLVPALEKMYGIDFRASTDDTGNAINGGDWKMETDSDYDVAADYLDAGKLTAYAEKMGLQNVLADMHTHKGRSPMVLYRVCQPEEAAATQSTMLAGGEERPLTRMKTPAHLVVQQVANNESIHGAAPKNEQEEKLAAILAAKGKSEQLSKGGGANRRNEVGWPVEFSTEQALQFVGALIKVHVNSEYVVKGSNAPGENGYLIQIGTPLSSVEIVRAA